MEIAREDVYRLEVLANQEVGMSPEMSKLVLKLCREYRHHEMNVMRIALAEANLAMANAKNDAIKAQNKEMRMRAEIMKQYMDFITARNKASAK